MILAAAYELISLIFDLGHLFSACFFFFFLFLWHAAAEASRVLSPCSCASCGYPLNLSSSNRITSGVGSEYRKSIKKGVISFASVDLSRFTQVDEVTCFPVSWRRRRTKTSLLCRNCGAHIGHGYADPDACHKFSAKLGALQPSDSGGH